MRSLQGSKEPQPTKQLMRNVFDQYTQPENRLTHSLVSVLHQDTGLLKSFLREFGPSDHPPPSRLQIIEQGLPGKVELDEGEAIKQGLPDALIFDDEGWVLVFESKISSGLDERPAPAAYEHRIEMRL